MGGDRASGVPLRIDRAVAGIAAFAVLAAGCVHTSCTRAASRPAIREAMDFVRHELGQSEASPPLVGARILERLPSVCPEECADDLDLELARRAARSLSTKPIEFSRQLIAEIRAIGWPSSHPESGSLTATVLLTAAQLRDDDLTPYRPVPGESGSPPPKSFVRDLALGYLARAQLWRWCWDWRLDESASRSRIARDVESFLWKGLTSARDDREVLLLEPFAESYVAVSDERVAPPVTAQRSLLAAWIAELPGRLRAPSAPSSVEIVLQRVDAIGAEAPRFGLGGPAKAVLHAILDAKTELPVTAGVPGAAWDLFVGAASALRAIEVPVSRDPSIVPPARRRPFDPWAGWLEAEPAAGEPSAAAVGARLHDLDKELDALRFAPARLAVIDETNRWLAPGEAERRFDRALPFIFDGARVRFSQESLHRISALLDMGDVDAARRIQLALRLLRTPATAVLPYDGGPDDHDRFTIYEPLVGTRAVQATAVDAVSRHPEWIERDASLRTWLEQRACRRGDPTAPSFADAADGAQPAFEALIAFHASGRPGARSEVARAVLQAWVDELYSALVGDVDRRRPIARLVPKRLLAVGELARQVGLASEARALLDAVLGGDARTADASAPSPWRDVGWSAFLARAMLDFPLAAQP
jgi:hypothetical protein